ncbi:MAG: SDR family oxidoreductase [Ilumatobacter sp.]
MVAALGVFSEDSLRDRNDAGRRRRGCRGRPRRSRRRRSRSRCDSPRRSRRPPASIVAGDIGDESTVRAMVDTALENHGRLDGIVNNAGIFGAYTRFEENSVEAFDEIVAINLRAAWLAMKFAKPTMLASGGGGSIVNIASIRRGATADPKKSQVPPHSC